MKCGSLIDVSMIFAICMWQMCSDQWSSNYHVTIVDLQMASIAIAFTWNGSNVQLEHMNGTHIHLIYFSIQANRHFQSISIICHANYQFNKKNTFLYIDRWAGLTWHGMICDLFYLRVFFCSTTFNIMRELHIHSYPFGCVSYKYVVKPAFVVCVS